MKKYKVIVPADVHPYPEVHELSAAAILANYFKMDVKFIRRTMTIKSADLKIGRIEWELKSPVGTGKRTFQNNLRKANKQSGNIVLDLRRCRITTEQALMRAEHVLGMIRSIQRLLVITKNGECRVNKHMRILPTV